MSLLFLPSLVPAKIVLDWKTLFILGRSLYEEDLVDSGSIECRSSFITTSSDGTRPLATNDQLLNDVDFQDYNVTLQCYIFVYTSLYVTFLISM